VQIFKSFMGLFFCGTGIFVAGPAIFAATFWPMPRILSVCVSVSTSVCMHIY
jgi:hypothetical protein